MIRYYLLLTTMKIAYLGELSIRHIKAVFFFFFNPKSSLLGDWAAGLVTSYKSAQKIGIKPSGDGICLRICRVCFLCSFYIFGGDRKHFIFSPPIFGLKKVQRYGRFKAQFCLTTPTYTAVTYNTPISTWCINKAYSKLLKRNSRFNSSGYLIKIIMVIWFKAVLISCKITRKSIEKFAKNLNLGPLPFG